jgi:hypothetical protein
VVSLRGGTHSSYRAEVRRGVGPDTYDKVRAECDWLDEHPIGENAHLTWCEGGDNHNGDAWQSEVAFAAFGETRLGPALAKLGVTSATRSHVPPRTRSVLCGGQELHRDVSTEPAGWCELELCRCHVPPRAAETTSLQVSPYARIVAVRRDGEIGALPMGSFAPSARSSGRVRAVWVGGWVRHLSAGRADLGCGGLVTSTGTLFSPSGCIAFREGGPCLGGMRGSTARGWHAGNERFRMVRCS